MSLDARVIRPLAEKASEAAWDVILKGLWEEHGRDDDNYTVTIKLTHKQGGLLDTTIDIDTRERART